MLHVAIDSNIYRSKPKLDSSEFKALEFLSENELITLHIPYFVEREFTSHLRLDQEKRLNSILKDLEAITTQNPNGEKTRDLIEMHKSIERSMQLIIDESHDEFIQWAEKISAIRHSFSGIEVELAMDAYFKGKEPFKEPKVRKDIPDSFIYQSLKAIKQNHSLFFISDDKALVEACEKIDIKCLSNLKEFVESDDVQELIKLKERIEIYKIFENRIYEAIEDKEQLLDSIEDELLNFSQISGDYIPGDDQTIYVCGVYRPSNLKIKKNVEHYGDGLFVLEFEASAEINYEYAAYKSDTYDLDRKKYHFEYLNDHYINVETTDDFQFMGRVVFDFGVSINDLKSTDELMEILPDPDISIEDLEEFMIKEE